MAIIGELPYPIVSADGHMNEPQELYERLQKNLRERVEFGTEKVDGGPEDAHKIFVGNASRIYGFDETKLSTAA